MILTVSIYLACAPPHVIREGPQKNMSPATQAVTIIELLQKKSDNSHLQSCNLVVAQPPPISWHSDEDDSIDATVIATQQQKRVGSKGTCNANRFAASQSHGSGRAPFTTTNKHTVNNITTQQPSIKAKNIYIRVQYKHTHTHRQ